MSTQDHGRLLRVCAYCKQAVVAAVVEYRRPALQRRTNALIIHCACVQFCVVESLRSAGVAAQSFDVRLNPTRSMCTSCCKIIFRGLSGRVELIGVKCLLVDSVLWGISEKTFK